MTKKRAFLLLTILFTLLFAALIAAGAYLYSIKSRQFATAAFLFSFAAAIGQFACLALLLREHAAGRPIPPAQGGRHV
ncbi:MAG: hypothetical protein Q3966_06700 [Neisseria sp.]|nr:hypothetical protein [Neisseria sp.]